MSSSDFVPKWTGGGGGRVEDEDAHLDAFFCFVANGDISFCSDTLTAREMCRGFDHPSL